MTEPRDPLRNSHDAVTTPVGVTTMCPQCGASMPAFETRCSACGHQRQGGTDTEQRDALRERLQAGIGDAYELVQMIGKGGMGVVFRARERALDREVALKVLAFDPLLVPEAFMRFEREAKLAARLDHPNIVPIFAVGQGRGIAFYTMRLVRGGSLEEQLTSQTKIEPARALRYLREIAAALDHAHANGVVHRDIKPANVMLGDGDHVFVADFGIARAVGGEGSALTSTGVVGSPAYMAPEQWQGQGIDGRADQYALGILAYELLTGKRPYRDASMHELLRLHLTENLPDITQELPSTSGRVRDVLARATAKEPKDRFASASEFVAELDRALFSHATPAQSAPTLITADLVRPSVVKKRAPVLPIAGTLVVLAVAAAVWQSQRGPDVTPPAAAPETVRVQTPAAPETVRVKTAAAPETVRVETPVPVPANLTAGNAAAPGGAASTPPGATGAAVAGNAAAATPQGYILIAHPMTPGFGYQIDGASVAPRVPAVYSVAPGRHTVTFKGAVPTIPPQLFVAVRPGDTVRALFAPATGGGARGDQLRQQVFERARRLQQQQGGGRGGAGGLPPRAGVGGRAPVRGDTLSQR